MAKIPKVILLIENARTYGRQLLRGIGRYARFHGPWSFYMEPEFYVEMGGRITKMDLSHIRRLKADGIIMRDIRHRHPYDNHCCRKRETAWHSYNHHR